MLNRKFLNVVVVSLLWWGCGGGSGPGVTPPNDLGPTQDSSDRGVAGDEGGEVPDLPVACSSDAECDDGNPCTKDTCESDGCRHQGLVAGACDDGDPCTEGESCQNGVCGGGDFVCECRNDYDCPAASDDCHVKTCDFETHTCVEGLRDDGTPCDDQDPCTTGEACWEGVCKGGAHVCECEGDDDCPEPQDECSPLHCDLADHKCKATPKVDGTACDDGDVCTLGDKCQAGACQSGTAKDCDDQDSCTKDSCDTASGECAHEFVPQFGCCESDADCDDRDPCTQEKCVKHRCERQGEVAGVTGFGCASVNGCSVGFCSEADGGCRSLSLDMPAVLFDWDLTTGQAPKGMRWTTEAGGLDGQGAGPKAGEGVASFVFPAHYVQDGVFVLMLGLADGLDCAAQGLVQVKVDGEPAVGASGCAFEAGRAVLGFPVYRAAVAPLDVEVLVKAGARVARATLYLWAVAECRPLGPVVAVSGTGSADLSVGGLRTLVGVGHRAFGDTIRFGRYSLWDGVKGLTQPASGKMTGLTTMHRTAMVPLAGDRWLFAYDGFPDGGGPSRIEVTLLNASGDRVAGEWVPRQNASAQQTEPFLVADASGALFLAYTTSEADQQGLGVVFRSVTVQGTTIAFGEAKTVNNDVGGDQTLPVLAWSGDGGVALWKSWKQGETSPSSLRLRKVSASGPEGLEFKVVESKDVYQSLSVVVSGDQYLVAATTSEGALAGFRVSSSLSASATPWTGVPDTAEWSDVTLLPATTGAVLVATRLNAGVARVVQVPVSQFGAMGEAVALSGPINDVTATPVLGAFGPFLTVLAFNDTLSAVKGARVALLAAKCASGPVSCAGGHASVCTGLGGTGYVQVAGADAWCP